MLKRIHLDKKLIKLLFVYIFIYKHYKNKNNNMRMFSIIENDIQNDNTIFIITTIFMSCMICLLLQQYL